MTWDPLGLEMLREDWVAAPEVVASEEVIEEPFYHILYIQKVYM